MNPELTAVQKMDALYNAEINVSIASFWDGGFEVGVGDTINGFVDVTNVYGFERAVDWAWETAKEAYPNSPAFVDPNTDPGPDVDPQETKP